MRKYANQTTYQIEMTVDEFTERGLVHDGDEKGYKVFSELNVLSGVREVEFNGHFGPNVFVTIETEHDNESTWNMIWEIIGGTDDCTS